MNHSIKAAYLMLSIASLNAMHTRDPASSFEASHAFILTADEVEDIAGDMEDMYILHVGLLTWARRAKSNAELLKDITPLYRPQGPNPLNYYFETMKLWHEICKKWNFDTSKVAIPVGCISSSQETALRELFKSK